MAASVVIQVFNIKKDETGEVLQAIDRTSRMGLRMCMTVIPIIVLIVGLIVFRKNYILTDAKLAQINDELKSRKED